MKLAVLAIALTASAAAPTPHLLRAQAWTAPSNSIARDLTHAPRECVGELSNQAEAGRALFRSPALLGGPAARLGLSCNACHSNGRTNARFYLPELTDRPGAADVTSEWASKVRGDGVMNPRDIPDLAGVAERPALGRNGDPSLEHFVHSVIEEEFQGPPTPPAAFDDLIAYVRALDPRRCAPGESDVDLESAASDVRRAVNTASVADAPTALLVLLAAQDGMGRIVERLPAERFAHERAELEALSRELGSWRDSPDVAQMLATAAPGWRTRFDAAVSRIAPRARFTYFDESTLRRALAR